LDADHKKPRHTWQSWLATHRGGGIARHLATDLS
jgi:hypothetical protein